MGTRSLTTFIETYQDENGKEHKEKIVTMYRQYDGYPTGHGMELAEFLASGKLVNGFGLDTRTLQFNGMGCLSAQVVAHFKEGVGGFYLYRGGTTNCGEEYRYEVIGNSRDGITLVVKEVGYINKKLEYVNRTRTIFKGTPKEFLESELVKEEA